MENDLKKMADELLAKDDAFLASEEGQKEIDIVRQKEKAVGIRNELASFGWPSKKQPVFAAPTVTRFHDFDAEDPSASFSVSRAARAILRNNWDEAPLELRRSQASQAQMNIELQLNQFGLGLHELMRTGSMAIHRDMLTSSAPNFTTTQFSDIKKMMQPISFLAEAGAKFSQVPDGTVTMRVQSSRPSAAWVAENAAATVQDQTATTKVVRPEMIDATSIRSVQFDASVAGYEDQEIAAELMLALAQRLDEDALIGTGVAPQPMGVMVDGSVAEVSLGTNGLQLSSAALAQACQIPLMNNYLRKDSVIITTAGVTQQMMDKPQITGGTTALYDGRSTVNGFRVIETNFMPSNYVKGTGTALHGLAVGDFSTFEIYFWRNAIFQIDPYTVADQGKIKYRARMYAGMVYPRSAAFARIKDIKMN